MVSICVLNIWVFSVSRNMNHFRKLPEYHRLTAEQFFNEVAPAQKPIVIRQHVKDWPLVAAGRESPRHFSDYLLRFYQGHKARIFVAPPSEGKRFFYNNEFTDVNYIRGEERADLFLGRLLELMDRDVYPAISIQNASPDELFPGLSSENRSVFFPEDEPHLWIGNEGIVSAHYDGSDNVACVVAGRRRF